MADVPVVPSAPPNVPVVPSAPPAETTAPTISWGNRFLGELRTHYLRYAGYLGLWFAFLVIALVKGAPITFLMGAAGTVIVVFVLLFQALLRTPPATAAQTATEPTPAQPHHVDSYREVVETVVFVVVLVLLLKSFAAEAFVIPTGSMAETLYGYQKMVTCPQCGYEFPVNCSSEVDPSEGRPRPVFGCTCPNCLKEIYWDFYQDGRNVLPRDFLDHHPQAEKIPNPGWHSGDRVLVSKFSYDLLQRMPERLNVVVFKYPGDSDFPRSGPNKNSVPMNYIKRLVGLSGETIAIFGGNLYRLPLENAVHYPEAEDLQDPDAHKRESAQKMLWRAPNMHQDFPEAIERFKLGQFKIIRKKPAEIISMRRIVYDNDHQPKDLVGRAPARWTGDAAWSADGATGFKAASAESEANLHWLHYQHMLRGNGDKPSLITDFMGYNSWDDGVSHRGNLGENWVGDLSLDCEVVVHQQQGQLVLELVKGVDRFQARWDLAAGTCTLVRLTEGHERVLASNQGRLKAGTHKLCLANVDARLTLWVDDELAFGDGVPYESLEPFDPNDPSRVPMDLLPSKNDLEPASIGVRGAAVDVRRMRLYRDTYYTVAASTPDVANANFVDPEELAAHMRQQSLTTLLKTLYVQPGHYLCLGDNSPESSDGRWWGLVPERLLLGRALLVYYPLNRAGRIR